MSKIGMQGIEQVLANFPLPIAVEDQPKFLAELKQATTQAGGDWAAIERVAKVMLKAALDGNDSEVLRLMGELKLSH